MPRFYLLKKNKNRQLLTRKWTTTMYDVSLTVVVNDWVKHTVNDWVKHTT